MAVEIEIFNFRDLFVNQIGGDVTIFIFLLLLMIALAAAKFRLPTVGTFGLFVVSLLILSTEYKILLPIILLVVGIFYTLVGLSRIVTRG